jgi:GntR family transcriptional regulator
MPKSTATQQPIQVRDIREQPFLWMDNRIVDVYAKKIGPLAFVVYAKLCRHTNKGQEAWPSIETIADETGISIASVKRALLKLKKHKLVKVSRVRLSSGEYTRNVYSLLSLPSPQLTQSSGFDSQMSYEVYTGTKEKTAFLEHETVNNSVSACVGYPKRGEQARFCPLHGHSHCAPGY